MQNSDLIKHLEAIKYALERVIGMAQAMADGQSHARAQDGPSFYSPGNDSPGYAGLQLNNVSCLAQKEKSPTAEQEDILNRRYGKGSYVKRERKRTDGSISVYYQGVFYLCGKRVTVTARTQDEIERKLNELWKQKYKTTNDKGKGYLLVTFIDEFWKKKKGDLAERSATEYQRMLTIIKNHFKHEVLKKIDEEDVEDFLLKRSPGTRVKYYDVLKQIFSEALRQRRVKENPCTFVKRPRFKSKKMRCYEFDEQNWMLDALPQDYAKLFFVLCVTGMRISEALALTPDDVKRNYILINKTVDTKTNKVIFNTKNGEERKIVYLPCLSEYLDLDFIKSVSYRTLNRTFQTFYKKFNGVNLHSTRHTYASVAHYVGIDDKLLQNQLGHKTIAMTQDTYTDLMITGTSPILDYFNELKTVIKSAFRR